MTTTQAQADNNRNIDQIAGNIEAIVNLHASSERAVPRHQRVIESLTGHLGRPISLYLMITFVSAWLGYNLLAPDMKMHRFDPPPFGLLQAIMSLSALLVTTMVLITQNRQATLAQQRSHLDIQINLLAEQKVAKLIALVEELRQDLPNVRNRKDPEAELMTRSADPISVAEELQKNLDQTNLPVDGV